MAKHPRLDAAASLTWVKPLGRSRVALGMGLPLDSGGFVLPNWHNLSGHGVNARTRGVPHLTALDPLNGMAMVISSNRGFAAQLTDEHTTLERLVEDFWQAVEAWRPA